MTKGLKKLNKIYVHKYKHKVLRDKRLKNKIQIIFRFEQEKAIRLLLKQFPCGLNINLIAKNLGINVVLTSKILKKYGFKYKRIGTNKIYQY